MTRGRRSKRPGSRQAWTIGKDHILYIFKAVKKTSDIVPLRFVMPSQARDGTRVKSEGRSVVVDKPDVMVLHRTANGLALICKGLPGFWYLPYSNIESYLEEPK